MNKSFLLMAAYFILWAIYFFYNHGNSIAVSFHQKKGYDQKKFSRLISLAYFLCFLASLPGVACEMSEAPTKNALIIFLACFAVVLLGVILICRSGKLK